MRRVHFHLFCIADKRMGGAVHTGIPVGIAVEEASTALHYGMIDQRPFFGADAKGSSLMQMEDTPGGARSASEFLTAAAASHVTFIRLQLAILKHSPEYASSHIATENMAAELEQRVEVAASKRPQALEQAATTRTSSARPLPRTGNEGELDSP